MKILVVNAGSSSLKYQLIDMENESVIAKGLVERIGIEGSNLLHRPAGRESLTVKKPLANHTEAMQLVLDALMDEKYGVIKDINEIGAVGHRVLHGGEEFAGSFVIDEKVMDAIRANIDLGPLHNPANLMGIEGCRGVMPNTPMVAVFDTAFHQTMPPKAYIYGIPYEYYTQYKVRRYGFHGTSHRYVSKRTAELLGKKPEELKMITCHLGNGSSIAAIDGGKVVDTSMGLTPLEGLLMGTRSGNIDPAILDFLSIKTGMTASELVTMLNKKSGLLGVTGFSSDLRDVLGEANKGNERAQLAVDILTYGVTKYIGSYAAAMGGVDVVVFTAGIGENNAVIRKACCKGLEFMGIEIDDSRNDAGASERIISPEGAKVTVMVVPTDEELMIARDTLELVSAL